MHVCVWLNNTRGGGPTPPEGPVDDYLGKRGLFLFSTSRYLST